MRKLFVSFIIIIPLVVFGILIYKNQNTTPQKSHAEILSASSAPSITNSIEINGLTFAWYEVNTDKLKLIPNFSEKLSSRDVITSNNCAFLSSASFYTKENTPTGLFISNGQTLANFATNDLFDGILSINDITTPRITRAVPQDNLQIATQTGPILKENNSFENLTIKEDTNSRRVIAAITGENKLYFMSIYDKYSEYSGPLLADLPNELKIFEQKSRITFADAVNMDGGAASTFNTPDLNLSEINPSGAFFCQF